MQQHAVKSLANRFKEIMRHASVLSLIVCVQLHAELVYVFIYYFTVFSCVHKLQPTEVITCC
jgi:hypothetical protein